MSIPAAHVAALARAERAGARVAKERARVLRRIDAQGGAGNVLELQAALQRHGVELSENAIQRARKVGQLLATLDGLDADPPELQAIHDAETLYLIQRASEVAKVHPRAILQLLEAAGGDRKAYLKQMVAHRSAAVKKEAAWRAPLRKAPADTCAAINAGFTVMCKALDVPQVTGIAVLGRIMTALSPEAWQRLAALADELHGDTDAAPHAA